MKYSIMEKVKEGRDSGYNYIDIAWYFLRWSIFGHLITKYPARYRDIEIWQKDYEHIVTPMTVLFHKITNKNIRYFTCKRCGWTQFDNPNCNRC